MLWLWVFAELLSTCSGATILLFLVGTTHFERTVFEFLAQQLALRNHNTITVKPILIPEEPRLVKPKLHLVREKTLKNLLPRKMYEELERAGNDVPWRKAYEYDAHAIPYYAAHNHSCYKMLNSNLMSTLAKDNIDVAIIYAGNPCQLAIVHALHIPFIYFDLEGFVDETKVASGTPVNLDVPSSHCPWSLPESTLLKRLVTAVCLLREYLAQSGVPQIARVVSTRYALMDGPISALFAEDYEMKKKFTAFPDVNSIKQNAELYFVNTDPLLEFDNALPPHVIPVGGMHLDHVKPLFSPWNTTIAAAEKGVIVVSLGTQANSSSMSRSQESAILGALKRFTAYRIYWRIGPNVRLPSVTYDQVPSHINLTAFLPQNDLIAHKRTQLLVTNGGMLSIFEAVAHGVPIVGIPLYGVNRQNLGKVHMKGLGVIVEKSQLTEESLYRAMKEVLDSSRYKTAAREMSKAWKDRSATPFDVALRHIEQVARHRAAKFLRPPRRAFAMLRTLNADAVVALLLAIILPLFISYHILAFCISLSFRTDIDETKAACEVNKTRDDGAQIREDSEVRQRIKNRNQ